MFVDHLLIDVVDLAKKSLVSYIEMHPCARFLVSPSNELIRKVSRPAWQGPLTCPQQASAPPFALPPDVCPPLLTLYMRALGEN